jgi:hypothetical protein
LTHSGPKALLALGIRLVGALPGDAPGVQAAAHRLAHLVAGEAGTHGPEEEFVIIEWVHSKTVGRVTNGGQAGVESGLNSQDLLKIGSKCGILVLSDIFVTSTRLVLLIFFLILIAPRALPVFLARKRRISGSGHCPRNR